MKRILFVLAGCTVATLLVFAATEGFEEMERERQLEKPVEVPQRLARDEDGGILVKLTLGEQEKAGLRVGEAAAGKRYRRARGFGTVRAPDSLLALEKEQRMTDASIIRARAEVDRVRMLFEGDANVSRRTVEAAEEELARLEAAAAAIDRQLTSEWGSKITALDPDARSALIDRLAGGESVYIDAHLLPGSGVDGLPDFVEVGFPGAGSARRADEITVAPRVASRLQGPSFLLRVDHAESTLRPGAPVTITARAPGPPEEGVVVPASAVVRFQGTAWIYVPVNAESFTRREVPVDRPVKGGWLVTQGFKSGDRIVLTGAQILLSEERRASIRLEDEEEEE